MEEVTFGQYAVPVILTVVLGLIFKMVPAIPDKWKSLISVLCGIVLGLIAIPYNSMPWNVVNIVDHAIYGLMVGASAVGLYELSRTVVKPRNGGTSPPKVP